MLFDEAVLEGYKTNKEDRYCKSTHQFGTYFFKSFENPPQTIKFNKI